MRAASGAGAKLRDLIISGQIPAVILFGPPGSGKGTQGKLLAKCVHGPHISSGDMLREHIEKGDEIGNNAEGLMRLGRLVPDEVANQLVKERIAQADCRRGFILDGYPRTLPQAEVLMDLAVRSGIRPVVVHLEVDYTKVIARISGRRQCPLCGTLYSLSTNPPKNAGVCDLDGTPLITRDDDSESVIRERLDGYERQTRPLLDFFEEQGVPMFEIDGASEKPEQITERICGLLAAHGITDGPGRS